MQYPGRVIKLGESDPRIVKAVKQALNRTLAVQRRPERLDPDNANFGPTTQEAVKLFQARNVDANGQPLKVDGELGSVAWQVLFGDETVPVAEATSDNLLAEMLKVGAEEEAKKVREVPVNSNKGPEVNEYLKRAGATPGLPWCCAFTYWCFDTAAQRLSRANPMLRTAGCLDHWARCTTKGAKRIPVAQAVADPGLLAPGMLFIIDTGGGKGHTGMIVSVQGGFINTIEGNTDASMTREGGGVYRLTRKINTISKGFIDYAGL